MGKKTYEQRKTTVFELAPTQTYERKASVRPLSSVYETRVKARNQSQASPNVITGRLRAKPKEEGPSESGAGLSTASREFRSAHRFNHLSPKPSPSVQFSHGSRAHSGAKDRNPLQAKEVPVRGIRAGYKVNPSREWAFTPETQAASSSRSPAHLRISSPVGSGTERRPSRRVISQAPAHIHDLGFSGSQRGSADRNPDKVGTTLPHDRKIMPKRGGKRVYGARSPQPVGQDRDSATSATAEYERTRSVYRNMKQIRLRKLKPF
eukprot:gnl/Dysnectes_brevis/2612_a3156_885.p1 GENE.gnl/Dysnectes_brevis/2612_a3156_885~~gnl/Dysnectes_brevis/2612_a3156_885.p1  ORF type:complete len:264 (-),score=52.93 gnl/Dysnectes_brevis/2612_a3156_885:83-874(-)